MLEAIEGGTARHVTDAVRHVSAATHHVAVPSERVGGVTDRLAAAAIAAAGGVVHRVDMRRSAVSPRNGAALLELRRLVRHVRPDIVHGHSSVGGALARAAAWRSPARRVFTPNGLTPARVGIAIERLLGHRTDRIVAVSASEAELVIALRLVPPERVVVVPNGIDLAVAPTEPGRLRSRIGVPSGVPLVGTVARLAPQKAPERFVAVCERVSRRVPGSTFVLIGDGPLRRTLEHDVRQAGLDGRFVHVPELAEAHAVIGDLDVYVSTSRFEGGPYAPLEAMRAGTPVVLTDVVGNRDVLEHGVSGIVAAEDDIDAMAEAVASILSDAARRSAFVEAARMRLRERFDVRQMGSALSRLYSELRST